MRVLIRIRAKAADGKRLHRLEPDPVTAPVVQRIFAEFLGGSGLLAIAEGLTRDGILCPSAYDRARNSHRSGVAWSKYAIRAILLNPRYTGRQVWSRQHKDEVLIDVHDVALGHMTKLRWNDPGNWIWSEQPAHEALLDDETFAQIQTLLAVPGTFPGRPETAPDAAPLHLPRPAVLRRLRAEDAGKLEQRQAALPLRVPPASTPKPTASITLDRSTSGKA